MAESLESRKFDRKPLFDVPLPMRRKEREVIAPTESASEEPAAPANPNTMAFSLLTKRGNRQQVWYHSSILVAWLTRCRFRLGPLSSHPIQTSPEQ
jgi:hypothetical protein